jgi:hypothetical protein
VGETVEDKELTSLVDRDEELGMEEVAELLLEGVAGVRIQLNGLFVEGRELLVCDDPELIPLLLVVVEIDMIDEFHVELARLDEVEV